MTSPIICDTFAGMNQMELKKEKLAGMFLDWAGKKALEVQVFPSSGSNRKYFRVSAGDKTAIGAIGEDPRENKAFIAFTKHFKKKGLAVPEIYSENLEEGIYLQEDIGDSSLFEMVTAEPSEEISKEVRMLYQRSLEELIRFQTDGSEGLDYSLCFPVSEFTEQSMRWDLNYFKYYYLRPSGVSYDEYALETDFNTLLGFLIKADFNYFIYRDFQSRNIFIRDKKPWFIDYQGGRKGPAQYDVASLLFQAKANLPHDFREEMLEHYITKLQQIRSFKREVFIPFYYGFVLLRLLQVLGAYGYRGFFEQKPHFIESAKYALENAKWFLENIQLPVELPELRSLLKQLIEKTGSQEKPKGLTVDVSSFSYLKYGYPKDSSGHGGGFVFDCRSLPNPGRYPEYKILTGKDQPVIDFLKREEAMTQYLDNVKRMISQAVDNYLVRGFDHLSVNFGCTGGQHRSVYCAENIYKYLRENYRIQVNLSHKMLDLS